MNNNSKLGNFQAILFILIVMINKIILNFPKKIILTTGTGSLINIAYMGIIILIFCLILNKLFSKFPSSDIIDISEFLGGKILKNITGIIFIVAFLIAILTVTINFTLMLKSIYFKESPLLFVLIFFLIGIVISNLFGFKSIIKTNCIIVPFIILSILVIVGRNIKRICI